MSKGRTAQSKDQILNDNPPSPWKLVINKQHQQQKWIRHLDGEEIWMTWQEVHQKGFMVLTAGFAIQHDTLKFDQFVQRIKDGWIEMRKSLPMLGCKFVQHKKTGDYFAVEYDVPTTDAQAQQWSNKTVIVKGKDEYDYEKETEQHPVRPDHQVAMVRILEGGGFQISNGTEIQNDNNHLVLFTVSHAMADIYTLCDVGRLLLDSIGQSTKQNTNFVWGTEVSLLPTSLTTAYKHFLGKRSAMDKKKSARYWGNGIIPMLQKVCDMTTVLHQTEIDLACPLNRNIALFLLSKKKKLQELILFYRA